jgi:plastocyanin
MYKKLFIALTVIAAMTLLLGGCAIVDTATMSSGPTVHMSGTDFVQSSITLRKGDMLNLVDDAPSPHVIVNGSWVNGTAKPSIESGAPNVNKTFNGSDSSTVGPFNNAGTFRLYCTIHQNMNLTVIVQ